MKTVLARAGLAMVLAFSLGMPAMAQTPAFDPTTWKPPVAGPKTQVLVLGSIHLSNLDKFDPASMSALLDKLAAYKPTVITIEALSGMQCDQLRRYPTIYPGVADQYCRPTDAAQKATGLDVLTAYAQAEAMLASWPANPTPAARRRLAATLLAANERASALVQWLRLPAAERRVGDGLDAALLKLLTDIAAAPNENYQIAAVLAARSGLERVYSVDDHTSDAVQSEDPAFEAAITRIWSSPKDPAPPAPAADANAATGMLNLFRYYNSPPMQMYAITSDFGKAAADKTPDYWGRQYVGWWEVRNLRMVANIRAAFVRTPGARVLSVVGASHKPYFDAYLNQMHEVELVDTASVLK
ncbi:DUF5694 domain-containing protein [Asticcacaulis sp. DW145]|uniref:DUF5694 domain-containing protein n=1 Tax=Asticcacaulis sp. DW145 TaxID=3095608 RepID=UPI003091BCD1|nr:DUF5694 domain-containing protein [Asticcacaulis sp. DW145]